MKNLIVLCVFLLLSQVIFAQSSPDYNGGLKVKFDEEGKKYLRIISWVQAQAIYNDNVPEESSNINFNLRRARIVAYAQINEKFLILTHFGLNNLNAENLSATGTGKDSQLFFHGVWGQYHIGDHAIGGGLHYWNGISRLNNQSTLNLLPLDNNRQSWSTLGLSDQFIRHLGVFGKGKFGKLQYRVAINEAITNSLDERDPLDVSGAVYAGRRLLGSKDAGFAYSGYFDLHILDQEANLLPFKIGTYLGEKKVFNVGAGFFFHPSGAVVASDNGMLNGEDVAIFAVDAFYDAPLGENGGAITAYASFQSNNYGTNYLFNVYGTGSMVYAHAGYVLPGELKKTRFQPYISFASNSYDAVDDNRNIFGIGANAFFSGHNSKLTLEYKNQAFGESETGTVTLQAMIYL
ncbi:MAG: hypothetical protein KJO05_04365 [Bacteroidia bacterium]|nr:hypothetical protein [Bacteroidia bacterium]NNF30670.1 hypothetical protein [Flavobacteriaceae bacterium]MBT8277285.1 hypothetical protein [Bacteroidia bacterium]NNJ81858.1 hypothetical protein [Flavobacteriaceae bacterium]NNK54885.1 hypothetical protein [Flavobacteriaceae bacterium]